MPRGPHNLLGRVHMDERGSDRVEAGTVGGTGSRVRVRGDEWRVSLLTRHAGCEAVRLAGCGIGNRGVVRTLLAPFDRFAPVTSPARLRVVPGRAWVRHVSRALGAARPFGSVDAARNANVRLMPFQLEPALATLRHGRMRLLIADEVGLGKTIQAGLILLQMSSAMEAMRALIVTPAGVREQWRQELDGRFSLRATLSDAGWLVERARDLPPDVNPWSLPGIYIASLDLVKRPEVLRALEDVTWDIAIFDEAHGIGLGTARLAAAHALGCSARRMVLMSATPPDGDPAHFAALVRIGSSESTAGITEFRRTRADAEVETPRKCVVMPVRLSRTERQMHRLLERYTTEVWKEAGGRHDTRARLATIILRKRALSSAASLALSLRRRMALLGSAAPPEEQQLLLPLQDEDPLDDRLRDDVLGASGLSDVASERARLEEIALVSERAAKAESKLTLLHRLLRRTSEPVIVFTEYRDTLVHIQAAVAGVRPSLALHGGMSPAERTMVQRAFNHSGSLLLATDAASEGLNLHERCRLVLHFELPWTPARLEQRTGRVDRLGQARRVHELLLVARDTSERLVLAPLMRRARTAANHGARTSRVGALTESDVAAVVMGDTIVGEDVAAPAAPASRLNLRAEAIVEAERLGASRRLARRATGPSRRCAPDDIVVTCDASAAGASALVVVEAFLERADGRRVHGELVPALVRLQWQRFPRAYARLRALAAEILRLHSAEVFARVAAHFDARWTEVAAQHRHALETEARRERDIAAARPSAARRLVQVGLFDARGANVLAARRRSGSAALLEAADRLTDLAIDAPPRTGMRVVAVRFGQGLQP